MTKPDPIRRPIRKSEYLIYFASRQAQRGWTDLLAVRRNDLVGAWEFLTSSPLAKSPLSYQLKGELSTVIRDGVEYDLWQLKLNLRDGARIWYYVQGNGVHVIAVHTNHPNNTK